MKWFFNDHGRQKENSYEQSVKIPFIMSLTDLFGLSTKMAGRTERRDNVDILEEQREYLFFIHGRPGTRRF